MKFHCIVSNVFFLRTWVNKKLYFLGVNVQNEWGKLCNKFPNTLKCVLLFIQFVSWNNETTFDFPIIHYEKIESTHDTRSQSFICFILSIKILSNTILQFFIISLERKIKMIGEMIIPCRAFQMNTDELIKEFLRQTEPFFLKFCQYRDTLEPTFLVCIRITTKFSNKNCSNWRENSMVDSYSFRCSTMHDRLLHNKRNRNSIFRRMITFYRALLFLITWVCKICLKYFFDRK